MLISLQSIAGFYLKGTVVVSRLNKEIRQLIDFQGISGIRMCAL